MNTIGLKPQTADVNGPFWGARARDWADLHECNFRALYEAVFRRLDVTEGTKVLDVGCGAGLGAETAAMLGAQIAALDASDELLTIARERLPEGDVRFGDLEELPFADKSFDVVTGFNSFQYAGNPEVALGEDLRNLPWPVRAEIEADQDVTLRNLSTIHYYGLDEFIGLASGVARAHRSQYIVGLLAFGVYQKIVGQFDTSPALIAIHCVVAANHRS